VAKIVRDVAEQGDRALFQYTARFDGYKLNAATVEATAEEKREALAQVARDDLQVITLAARRIADYHRHQIAQGYKLKRGNGSDLEQRILPLQRAGIYAPGGKASYPPPFSWRPFPRALPVWKKLFWSVRLREANSIR